MILFMLLLAGQAVELSANLRAALPHLEVVGAPIDIDTDDNPATDEVLIHARHLFPPVYEGPPDPGPYAFQVFAFRNGAVCAGPVFGWSPTPDQPQVSGRRLSVVRDGVWTRYRLDTPGCQ